MSGAGNAQCDSGSGGARLNGVSHRRGLYDGAVVT